MKITDTWISAAIAKNRSKPKYRKTVDRGPARPGLMVTVYSDGTGAFVMRYTRPTGARVFMPMGAYGKAGLSLAEACTVHDAALSLLEKGLDPIDDKERRIAATEQGRRERAGADSIASLVEQFVHRKLRGERWDGETKTWSRDANSTIKRRKRPEAAEALLRSNLVNAELDGGIVGNLKAREITRRQLVRLLQAIVDRGSPVAANRVHALLKQMFAWAATQDIVPASPMAGVERPGGDEESRDRTLGAGEIRAFWSKLDTAKMDDYTRLGLKLLLVTAQRRGELTFAKWADFDLDREIWTIPIGLLKSAHRRKKANKKPHLVPLSPLALEILGKLKALSGSTMFVLPARSDVKKSGSFSERALSRAVRENEEHFGIDHFTPHDLRRTAATFMAALGVPGIHVEKVLNHSLGALVETYDQHHYTEEKRSALEKWSTHLSAIIAGKDSANVVPLVRHA
jgi:integrase